MQKSLMICCTCIAAVGYEHRRGDCAGLWIMRAGLQSQQWGRKKAAALAAARLAEDGAEPLRPHVLALLNALLTEVSSDNKLSPGRGFRFSASSLCATCLLPMRTADTPYHLQSAAEPDMSCRKRKSPHLH